VNKRISIITAVLNGAATIADCLASVSCQSHAVEHIIVDGGSTDGTLEIVARLASDDSRVTRVVSGPDKGIYDAMNKGIALASGDVVGILNADDFYAGPEVLAKVAGIFADESIDACYGDLVYVKDCSTFEVRGSTFKTVRYWKAGEFKAGKFYHGWMPPHPTFFVRRRVYEHFGTFDPAFGSAADYELMLRLLLSHGVSMAYIPEVLVKMRVGGTSNATLKNRLRANRMDRLAWKANGLKPYPWTLYMKPLRKLDQWFKRP